MIADFGLLVLWGTLVGLDMASVGQIMIARPLVAGTVAGIILGDPLSGGTVGMILELFALDVLPVGGVRYPDYGLGAVAAATAAAGAPGAFGIGIAVVVGLVVAYVGEVGVVLVRRGNTNDVRRHRDALDAGRLRVVRDIHYRGLMRDVVRSSLITLFGLGLAVAAYRWAPATRVGALLMTLVLVGTALGAATSGIVRMVERTAVVRWFGLGILGGVVFVVVVL
jgi:mannose/fructose/N-acetylgalactosamine-specific phosphotransferase system component IIC